MVKRILVALDGSSRASDVLAAGAEMARRYDAKLTLVRAVAIPSGIPQEVWKLDATTLGTHLLEQADSYLKSCSEMVPHGLLDEKVPRAVTLGVPWDAICAAARDIGSDMVVIGSHGYGVLDRLLGTTAAKVVNHAPCAVLVIRAREDSARSAR